MRALIFISLVFASAGGAAELPAPKQLIAPQFASIQLHQDIIMKLRRWNVVQDGKIVGERGEYYWRAQLPVIDGKKSAEYCEFRPAFNLRDGVMAEAIEIRAFDLSAQMEDRPRYEIQFSFDAPVNFMICGTFDYPTEPKLQSILGSAIEIHFDKLKPGSPPVQSQP